MTLIVCYSGSLNWSWVIGMFSKILVGVFCISIIVLIFLLQTTTPGTIGPVGILFVFVTLYVSVLCVLTFLLIVLNRGYARVFQIIPARHPVQRMSLMRAYYFSSILALGPVMVVGMQSVGQVGIYEIGLVVLFLVISCIYVAKRTS